MNNSYVANCKPWVYGHCVTANGAPIPWLCLATIDKCAVTVVDIAIKKMMASAKY